MLALQDLTVGQVSGIIAAAAFVGQLLVPVSLPVIMVGLLRLQGRPITASAVSWSVIGRFLHSSFWPVILCTDSAATVGVSKIVLSVHRLSALTATLVSIATIVTPLGLYEAVSPEQTLLLEPFHYIQDKSPMGFGTPPRKNNTWSRICGGFYPVICPNSSGNLTTTGNFSSTITVEGDSYDSRIPQYVIDVFQSGLATMGASASSIFDIQWRFYTKTPVNDSPNTIPIDNSTAYTAGSFRQITSYILSDAIVPIEGLIVDMKRGGVGFRNHSAPKWRPYGSCVDTNLTLDFKIPEKTSSGNGLVDLVLTDRGGFVDLIREYPHWDREDAQNKPELWKRAYRAAWLNNAYSMAFMNVTNVRNQSDPESNSFEYLNSAIGKRFSLYGNNSRTIPSLQIRPSSLWVSRTFGHYLEGTDEAVSASNSSLGSNWTIPYEPALYPNPFNIFPTNFSDIGLLCSGTGREDYANITNIAAECGLLYGAPRRQDDSASLLFDPGSFWTIPLYTCASVTKAIIKTVSLRFNGSDDLSGLIVTDLNDKVYPNDDTKPLWGVENTEIPLRDVKPLWGLIAPEMEKRLNLSTMRKESLYLPGYTWGGGPSINGYQNLPGVDFQSDALGAAYDIGVPSSGRVDYSGSSNLLMYRLWQDLSQNSTNAAKIFNLVWTDVAANSVVGTRSLEAKTERNGKVRRGGQPSGNLDTPPIIVYEKRIKYRYPYGIPAFLALFTTAGALVVAFFMILSHAQLSHIRTYLYETSAGRLLTSQLEFGADGTMRHTDISTSGRKWANTSGRQQYTLGIGKIVVVGELTEGGGHDIN
ncbi:hypothetical protein ABW20_dc0108136 [Dactylellina cionopaga]|nr:hypothetical protein ABW20_dc0108136 [Dactylellina cionopaga]